MARTPEFERDVVVRQAMDVFWRRGFQGASLSLLGAAMGLKPGSIYAAFGNKEELFREALAAYVKRVRDAATAAERAPEEIIEQWFARHITQACDAGDDTGNDAVGRGCLLLNSATEASQMDAATRAMVAAELQTLERFFRQCIVQARRNSQREAVASPLQTARLLVAALAGISALSRAGVPRKSLEGVAQAALACI